MFSLIITILSIALVAALALATLYYGGAQFSKGSDMAQVSRVLNEGSQLAGAMELYKSQNGSFPKGTSEQIGDQLRVENFLKQIPAGDWKFANDMIITPGVSAAQCLIINKKVGLDTIPSCAAVDPGKIYCCEN